MGIKTDAELECDVLAELRGNVPSYATKCAALTATERVKGVRAVAQELEIALTKEDERTDAKLAQAAATAIEWNAFVPRGKVTVAVEKGWVTLRGSLDHEYQRNEAERAVRSLVGLNGVWNQIMIAPRQPAAQTVKAEIEAALKRHAEVDANRIAVRIMGDKVTLSGNVPSWQERREAERAAWAAPGVVDVEDLITVTG